MPRLFRRRQVLLPTLWGWLLIVAVFAVVAGLAARHIGSWLALTAPLPAAQGGAARLLLVEGWLDAPELDVVAEYARAQRYARVITTGGPIDDGFSPYASFAERAAARLRERLPGLPIDAAPSPHTKQDRTFASAVWARDWAREHGVAVVAFDVYSAGAHARRSRMLYRLAFGAGTQVGIIAGMPQDADPERWWTTSEAAKSVLVESFSLAWTQCCFWPPPQGSHEERWAVPPR